MARSKGWTCQRRKTGVVCRTKNPARKRLCLGCGKPKPAKRQPAHMAALKIPYEKYIELNGGEFCAICKAKPNGRRLDRDHCHVTGRPRGLLCRICNRGLTARVGRGGPPMTSAWLRSAALYLERKLPDIALREEIT